MPNGFRKHPQYGFGWLVGFSACLRMLAVLASAFAWFSGCLRCMATDLIGFAGMLK